MRSLEILSNILPGNHIALIYKSTFELLDVTANYLKAGIDQGECCILYISRDLVEESIDALTEEGMDVSALMLKSQLQIMPYESLFSNEGKSISAGIDEIKKSHDKAISFGYARLRKAFCGASMRTEGWLDFLSHERNVIHMLGDTDTIIMKAFPEGSISGSQMLDVLSLYDKVIIKRQEKWSNLHIGL
jgi:hypothetical protein